MSDLFEVLRPCRYSILIVVIGVFSFLVVPQGQDVLRRLAEWGGSVQEAWPPLGAIAVLLAAVISWALSSWYWARVILYLRDPDSAPDTARQARFRVWVPRLIGAAALAGMGLALARAALSYVAFSDDQPVLRLSLLAGACFVATGLFLWFVTKRRDLIEGIRKRRGGQAGSTTTQAYEQFSTAVNLPAGTRRNVALGLGVAIVLGLWFTFSPISAGRFFGTVPILMITAATWVLFGTGLLYVGRQLRLPVIALLLLCAAIFSFWNDNHAIRLSGTPDVRVEGGSIQGYFGEWHRGIAGDDPIFLVAAEGGGIRAAYWTGLVLSTLQERNPTFARHVFAISGISGGSLGAGMFNALLAESQQAGGRPLRCGTFSQCAQGILGRDFLSPTLAKMIAPDLGQRFLPFRVPFLDRGRVLEDSWARGWQEVTGSSRLDEPFLSLWQKGGMEIPALVLNGTHVESGRRIVATNLSWQHEELDDTYDLLRILRSDLALKSALHNSARFTYISPAGTMRTPSGKLRGHTVDGGYFENSGAVTALDLHRVIEKACPGCGSRIHVIYLRNSPTTDPRRTVDPANPDRDLADPQQEPNAQPYPALNELLSPPRALLNTRGARGSLAVSSLRALLRRRGAEFLELGLCDRIETKDGRKSAPLPLPLGWQLSANAQQAIAAQIDGHHCTDVNNRAAIETIHRLLNPMPASSAEKGQVLASRSAAGPPGN